MIKEQDEVLHGIMGAKLLSPVKIRTCFINGLLGKNSTYWKIIKRYLIIICMHPPTHPILTLRFAFWYIHKTAIRTTCMCKITLILPM